MVPWIAHRLGRISYDRGLVLMSEARARVLAGGPDELWLLEHDPVVTLGRRGGVADRVALAALGATVVATDRGGLATWHGPGQLVAYPVVDLRRRGLDVGGFVASLGAAMVAAARAVGVERVAYDPARPGVYRGGRKLGSIGLHVHRGVTTHGLALNVCCDLQGFQAIEPCGDGALTVTTLALEAGRPLALGDVASPLIDGLRGQLPWGRRGSPGPD